MSDNPTVNIEKTVALREAEMAKTFSKELIELLAVRHMKSEIWVRDPIVRNTGGGINIRPGPESQIRITAIRGTFDMGK